MLFRSDLNKEVFNINGVTKLIKEEDKVTFFYKGNINEITKALSSIKVRDVNMEEPTLEEVFMHYYE